MGEKDNLVRIDREKMIDGEIIQLRFYNINLWACVCKTYLTFTLALKQRCKSSIGTPHKEHRPSLSDIAYITRLDNSNRTYQLILLILSTVVARLPYHLHCVFVLLGGLRSEDVDLNMPHGGSLHT